MFAYPYVAIRQIVYLKFLAYKHQELYYANISYKLHLLIENSGCANSLNQYEPYELTMKRITLKSLKSVAYRHLLATT